MNTYIVTAEKYDCIECDNRAVTPVNGRCPHCGSTVLVLAEEPENRVDENLTIVEGVPEWAIWYLENPNESREEASLEELTCVPDMEDYHMEREVEEDGCTQTRAIYYVPRLKKILYSNFRENVVNVDIEGHYLTDASNLKKLVLDISFNPGEKVGDEFELQGYSDRIPLYTETVMEEEEGIFDIIVMDGTKGL